MRRSFFVASFMRILAGLAPIVAIAILWSGRRSVEVAVVFAGAGVVLAAVLALGIIRLMKRGLVPLQTRAEKIPGANQDIDDFEPAQYSELDDLAGAIGGASTKAHAALQRASERRSELEALLDSMQDAVVAVDAAGRIQWTNVKMQRLIPGSSVQSAVRVGHALVQTVRDPEVLECVKIALDDRIVCERRTTTMMPGRIFEVNASPMPGGGAVAVLHDITRIEEVERTQKDF